jgi:hypothetical protein
MNKNFFKINLFIIILIYLFFSNHFPHKNKKNNFSSFWNKKKKMEFKILKKRFKKNRFFISLINLVFHILLF